MNEDELLNIYRAAVDSSMDAAHSREGFASNMSRESILAGLRAIERAVAARALEEAAHEIFADPYGWRQGAEQAAFHAGADAVYAGLRARAAEIRERQSGE